MASPRNIPVLVLALLCDAFISGEGFVAFGPQDALSPLAAATASVQLVLQLRQIERRMRELLALAEERIQQMQMTAHTSGTVLLHPDAQPGPLANYGRRAAVAAARSAAAAAAVGTRSAAASAAANQQPVPVLRPAGAAPLASPLLPTLARQPMSHQPIAHQLYGAYPLGAGLLGSRGRLK